MEMGRDSHDFQQNNADLPAHTELIQRSAPGNVTPVPERTPPPQQGFVRPGPIPVHIPLAFSPQFNRSSLVRYLDWQLVLHL